MLGLFSTTNTSFFDCPDGITTDNMEVMKDMVKTVHAKDIVLDAGHGGSDTGAIYDGRYEKDDNLRLTIAVGEILEENGITLISYRDLIEMKKKK